MSNRQSGRPSWWSSRPDRELPFPLFPALFPGLYAVWFFTADDGDAEEYEDEYEDAAADAAEDGRTAGAARRRRTARDTQDSSRARDRRSPLTDHTRKVIDAFLKLLDTRRVERFPDLLTDPWQLPAILAGLPTPPITYSDLDGIAALRDNLGVAVRAGGALDAHDLLNDLAIQHGVTPQLTGAGELTHLTVFHDATASIAALFIPPLMELHALGWSDRVGECAEPKCWSLFLDLSKKGSQVYCSSACASRARTRRLRVS